MIACLDVIPSGSVPSEQVNHASIVWIPCDNILYVSVSFITCLYVVSEFVYSFEGIWYTTYKVSLSPDILICNFLATSPDNV